MKMPDIAEETARPISKWTCHQLEGFSDYIAAYAKAQKKARPCYLELYAGSGSCFCRSTDCYIEGAAPRALKTKPNFSKYIFVVKNAKEAESLKTLTAGHNGDIEIIIGSPNTQRVIRRIFDLIPRTASTFAFIDHSGYRKLHWSTLTQLAAHGTDWQGNKMELLIVFPLEMALIRNLMRPASKAAITKFYGNQLWEETGKQRAQNLISLDEARDRLVKLFKAGLKGMGYQDVADLKPVSPINHPFYHLILASDTGTGAKFLKDAWGKPRYLPCELFHD
ncbi:three-Cys-motif partner protein TcmP [Chloroflexota bacterium]